MTSNLGAVLTKNTSYIVKIGSWLVTRFEEKKLLISNVTMFATSQIWMYL